MRKFKTMILAAASLAVVATPAFAAAPAKKPAQGVSAVEPPASEAEVKNAMLYLKVLISGLESKNVEQPAKGALVGCLYNNSLGKITHSMDQVIARNPGKISRDNMNQLLSAMVMICGYKPTEATGAGTGAATPPPPATGGAASNKNGR